MIQRRCRAGNAEGRNIQGSTGYYRLMQTLRLSIWQSQALQNCCTLQSAWQTWIFPHHFHWGLALVSLRMSPSTTEQEQDEGAWITVLTGSYTLIQVTSLTVICRPCSAAVPSPSLDRKAQNEDLSETGWWLFSGLDKIAIQPTTNHQPSNKDSRLSSLCQALVLLF